MRLLGRVVKLQIQCARLKRGERPERRYDPEPLLEVPEMELANGGVWGWTDKGERLIDVHNKAHESHNHRGENGVCLGFTSHYASMRARFGPRLADGIAGENILIESEELQELSGLSSGLCITDAGGDPVRLSEICVAEPCLEFTRYALDQKPKDAQGRTVSEALQFLRRGLRGFYASWQGPPARIRVGAQAFVAGPEH